MAILNGDSEASLYFENSLFDGIFRSDYKNLFPTGWGGFVGELTGTKGHVYVTNSLFAPTNINSACTSGGDWRSFVRGNEENVHLANCYYKNPGDLGIGEDQAQGTSDATNYTPSELRAALDGAWKTEGESAVVPIMKSNPFAGSGTEESPYLIESATDWKALAYLVNNGYANFSGKTLKLTADIKLTEVYSTGNSVVMAGVSTSDNTKFRGIFDGDGHTMTLNITDYSDNNYCAPFRYIKGATIKNLHVTGSIIKWYEKNAGGLVGKAEGSNIIRDCRSSVDISVPTYHDASSGGLIGELRNGNTTQITNCLFDGELRGDFSYKWGGFIGWVADGNKAVFTNCLFAPKAVDVQGDDNRTFARRKDGGDLTFVNCYYTRTLGSAQGKQVRTISTDEHVTMTPYGTEENGTEGGITAYNFDGISYNPCIKVGSKVYSCSGNGVILSLALNGEPVANYETDKFIATPGSLTALTDYDVLNMPNADVTISLAPADFTTGHEGTAADPYLIYTDEQWKMLVSRIHSGKNGGYSGKYFRLMADITLTETHTSGDSEVMVGISKSDDTKFRGEFDGHYHTITLDITDTSDDNYCGLFRYIKDATIKSLHVRGTIKKTKAKYVGGLVGVAEGLNNTISTCRSSVDIQFNKDGDVTSGGFIGGLRGERVENPKERYNDPTTYTDPVTTLTDCLFDGKLQGANAYCWGGFVGWVAEYNTANFKNCLFNPEQVSIDMNDKNDNSRTFARKHANATVDVTNCYYKTLLKEAEEYTLDASEYSNGYLADELGDSWNIFDDEVRPIMGQYTFDGEGTQGSPYVIASMGDWNGLVTNALRGETYSGKYFQLAGNITVSRMVKNFQGTFDGAGNKLTFNPNYNSASLFTAPFRSADNATVENLHIDGTITTPYPSAAGIIGTVKGNTTIRNCRCSITIESTSTSDNVLLRGYHYGGFIGSVYGGKTVFTGCVFDGSMIGRLENDVYYAGHSGCFVGSTLESEDVEGVWFNDCVSDFHVFGLDPATSMTFINCSNEKKCHFNNSYYIGMHLGETYEQGKCAYSITAGEGITMENVGGGSVTEYDVSGITGYFPGIRYSDGVHDDKLLAGEGEEVRLNLDYDRPGYSFTGYVATYTFGDTSRECELSGDGNPYTLIMPDYSVSITATATKNILTLTDGADNTASIEKYDGKIADVTYDRVLSAVDNGDGTWTPRCYTICLPYDFDLYENVESGQADIYRLKYVDSENSQFVFTNDFGFASGGYGWLIVVNFGTVSLNATGVMISAQTTGEEVYVHESHPDEAEDPQVAGYWTGTFSRIYDEEAEPLNIYGMQGDGNWQRSRVTSHGPQWSWIESFRAFFQATEPLESDTFKPVFTFTGAADYDETGEIKEFPVDSFEGDLFNEDATGIVPTIRTIEADGSSRYFDLQGRQVKEKPGKGIYIKDGKKYFNNIH